VANQTVEQDVAEVDARMYADKQIQHQKASSQTPAPKT
jgi:hypothetical protein